MTKENNIVHNTNAYRNIHKRFRYKYGKADRCENPECENKSRRFDWALREGKEYSMNREDYQMLCRSCHMLQDARRGDDHRDSKLTEDQVRYIKSNPEKLSQEKLAAKFNVSRQAISLITTNKNWKHI